MDLKMVQLQQFIRSLAFANPQQQEQLLQRVPMQKRAQVLMRAQQIRQQHQQQQQQQQQGYNPGGGGIVGTGGVYIIYTVVLQRRAHGQSTLPWAQMGGGASLVLSILWYYCKPLCSSEICTWGCV